MGADDNIRQFLVVGVGASAGGLEALERMFGAMPPEIGMAFVVIQHLSPDFESRMDELLQRQTALPIYSVSDGMEVEANAIYLIPPRKDMIIAGGKLLLSDRGEERTFCLPIDHFFRSLAHDCGRRAVAVVLSGAGSDGSRGLREVHEAGGLVIGQTPDSARFQGMPLSAKETGLVDLFLKPEEVAHALQRYSEDSVRVAPELGGEPPEVVPGSAIDEILRALRNEYGIDFAYYKPSTVLRRIDRRLQLRNARDLAEYAELVRGDSDELNALYRDLLIGVTRFFRDLEAFQKLESEVLPAILLRVPPDEEIRVWVAACATGEEAYSLAILLHEQLEAAKRPLNARIFATDVHRVSLDVASAGVYDEEALSEVSPTRRQRYFSRDGNRYKLAKELRQLIVFARHDVITDAPFTRLNLITCRNLLIYFQPLVQKKVLSLFHFALKTGGTMFLGPSETPGELADEFDALDGHWKIYSKRRDSRVADTRISFPILPTGNRPPMSGGGRAWPGPQMLTIYDQLLDKAMGPSMLVDERYQLVHSFGGAESLLRVKGGRPSMNVLDLVDERWKAPLLGAFQHAQKQQIAARFRGVPIATDEGQVRYSLSVEPLGDSTAVTHFLVRLERAEAPPVASEALGEPQPSERSAHPRDYVTALESELRFTKESLQATIEELETANEELQATNEELVASNEELQSTNEELHSVNEELYTVNVEHQRKITQLSELTDDLDNLLHSIEVGVLFLDESFCIRKFTAHMSRVFKLLPQDVGRPFDSFTHTIQHPGLEADVRAVAKKRTPIDREVTSKDGVIYLLRILPYRGATGKGGVVVTLIDVSKLKRSEANVRRLSAIVESSADAILSKDLGGRVLSWNKGAERLYGYTAEEVVGRHISFLIPEEKRVEAARLLDRAAHGELIEPFETLRTRHDGTRVDVSLSVSPVIDEHERVVGVSTIARDVTQRKRDEAEVRRALRTRDQFMAMLSHELRNPLAALMHACAILHRSEKSEKQKRAVDAVTRQCKHMARLLDDLLDVSRMRQDGIELRKQPIDLRTTVESAVERIRPLADAAGVKIEVELPEHEITVIGDSDRLQQVEANLLGNAVKYTPDGRRVKLELSSQSGRACLRVKDEGIGVPPNMLERIFEPFVRAVEDDKPRVHGRASDGMGLGLALVRSIVQAHGGDVWAESAGADKGSLFVVALPLARESELDAGDAEPEKRALSILLVEDQDDSRELLKEILAGAGYQVTTAENGKRAVELVAEARPAIALVDIGLPEMSGYQVAAEIRRLFPDDNMFLVALTGYGQQQDRDAVLHAGFDQHLVKPVEAETLLEVLRSRRRLRRVPPLELRDASSG